MCHPSKRPSQQNEIRFQKYDQLHMKTSKEKRVMENIKFTFLPLNQLIRIEISLNLMLEILVHILQIIAKYISQTSMCIYWLIYWSLIRVDNFHSSYSHHVLYKLDGIMVVKYRTFHP